MQYRRGRAVLCAACHCIDLYCMHLIHPVQNGHMELAESTPLYLQIAEQLSQAIRQGTLARGEKLPSVRETARQYEVAQTTVVQAYHWLEDARLIVARPRSGFYVASRSVELPEPSIARPIKKARAVSLDWLGQRVMWRKRSEGMVSFSSGTPGPDLLNVDRVRRAVARSVQQHRQLLCTYPGSDGHEDARRALARYAVGLGCSLDPERIIITGGCMDSVALCLRAVTQPGDVVALESPTHFSFLEVLQALQLKALEIPTHPRHGISLDALQLALDTQPVKALVLVPTLSNPLGCCMPQADRKRLVQMAAQHDLPVIEDAIYADLAEGDAMRRTLKSYDSTGHVMLCHSFSKTLAPGLRLGWLEGGRWTEQLRHIKEMQAGGQSAVLELALADLVTQAGHAAAMRQLRAAIAVRVEQARQVIAESFPQGTRVSDPPGGLLLWLELPAGLDAAALHEACLTEQILIAPGAVFGTAGRFRSGVRIGLGGDWTPQHLGALKRVGEIACAMLAKT